MKGKSKRWREKEEEQRRWGQREKDEDEEERRRRWGRSRVYNSPPGSSSPFVPSPSPRPFLARLYFLLPPGPFLPPFPLALGIFSRAHPREAARSRQAAKREQTDRSRVEPTPTARGRYTLLRFALLIRSVGRTRYPTEQPQRGSREHEQTNRN